jgi:hypothetical protein
MSEYRASFVYSAAAARRAYLSFLWNRFAVFVLVSPVILGWTFAYLASRDYAPFAGFVLGIILVYWASWVGGLRRAGRVASAWGNPEVHFIATDETFTFRTPLGESIMKWSAIANLYRLRRFWIFQRVGLESSSFVPVEALDSEAQAFVERQVRQSGGRVS